MSRQRGKVELSGLQFPKRHCNKCGEVMVAKARSIERYGPRDGEPVYDVEYKCPRFRSVFDGHNRWRSSRK